MGLTAATNCHSRAGAPFRHITALAMTVLLVTTVLAGCGKPGGPSTTLEPTVAYTPPPAPTTTRTPLPPITLRIAPGVITSGTGTGISFFALTNVPPEDLPSDCSWEWDFGDASGKVVLTGGRNDTQWHPYAQNRQYVVNLVLRDGQQGMLASANTTVTVDDTPLLKECKTIEVSFRVQTLYRSTGDDPPNTYSWDTYEDWAGIRFDNLVWNGNQFSASSTQVMGDGSQRVYKITGGIVTKSESIEMTVLNWETHYTSPVTDGRRTFILMGMPLVKGGYTANVRGEFYASAVGSTVPGYVKEPFYDWQQWVSGPVTHIEFMGFDLVKSQPKIEVRFRK